MALFGQGPQWGREIGRFAQLERERLIQERQERRQERVTAEERARQEAFAREQLATQQQFTAAESAREREARAKLAAEERDAQELRDLRADTRERWAVLLRHAIDLRLAADKEGNTQLAREALALEERIKTGSLKLDEARTLAQIRGIDVGIEHDAANLGIQRERLELDRAMFADAKRNAAWIRYRGAIEDFDRRAAPVIAAIRRSEGLVATAGTPAKAAEAQAEENALRAQLQTWWTPIAAEFGDGPGGWGFVLSTANPVGVSAATIDALELEARETTALVGKAIDEWLRPGGNTRLLFSRPVMDVLMGALDAQGRGQSVSTLFLQALAAAAHAVTPSEVADILSDPLKHSSQQIQFAARLATTDSDIRTDERVAALLSALVEGVPPEEQANHLQGLFRGWVQNAQVREAAAQANLEGQSKLTLAQAANLEAETERIKFLDSPVMRELDRRSRELDNEVRQGQAGLGRLNLLERHTTLLTQLAGPNLEVARSRLWHSPDLEKFLREELGMTPAQIDTWRGQMESVIATAHQQYQGALSHKQNMEAFDLLQAGANLGITEYDLALRQKTQEYIVTERRLAAHELQIRHGEVDDPEGLAKTVVALLARPDGGVQHFETIIRLMNAPGFVEQLASLKGIPATGPGGANQLRTAISTDLRRAQNNATRDLESILNLRAGQLTEMRAAAATQQGGDPKLAGAATLIEVLGDGLRGLETAKDGLAEALARNLTDPVERAEAMRAFQTAYASLPLEAQRQYEAWLQKEGLLSMADAVNWTTVEQGRAMQEALNFVTSAFGRQAVRLATAVDSFSGLAGLDPPQQAAPQPNAAPVAPLTPGEAPPPAVFRDHPEMGSAWELFRRHGIPRLVNRYGINQTKDRALTAATFVAQEAIHVFNEWAADPRLLEEIVGSAALAYGTAAINIQRERLQRIFGWFVSQEGREMFQRLVAHLVAPR